MYREMTFCLLLAILLAWPAQAQEKPIDTGKTRKPILVCSTTQVADFARQVVGDSCEVHCILAPGADPHTYMPTPGDAKLVLKADLCLQNGMHLEGKNWMQTLAQDAGKPLLTCTEGVQPIELEAEGQKVNDPHTWFTPRNAAIYVNNIVRGVSKLDPAHKADYEARAKLYLQELRVLDSWIREQFNSIPIDSRILVTSHDAFNYFAKEYGFKNQAPVGWSTGAEVGAGMTPERRKQVIESIKSFRVKAVFVETSVNPKLVREIANEAGVKVGGELYSDSMGPAGSAGESYIGMMRENVLVIATSLR
ncbi:MAG: zinc ABC transporter substrate-binding protein [Desulfomonile tiedjei]|nr:zinc ABC transporter substrate-binding protein [Desulfomonile tiedjei]